MTTTAPDIDTTELPDLDKDIVCELQFMTASGEPKSCENKAEVHAHLRCAGCNPGRARRFICQLHYTIIKLGLARCKTCNFVIELENQL